MIHRSGADDEGGWTVLTEVQPPSCSTPSLSLPLRFVGLSLMARSLRFATDAEVASLAAQGDRDAFGELYDRFGVQLFDFCARLTGSSDDAADVTHEVFLRASSRLSQLREPERVRAWLFSVARHECYAFTRRRSKTRPSDPMRLGDTLEHTGRSAAGTLESSELVTLVNDARAGLEADDLSILDLKFRHDLSGNDLAEAAGIPHEQLHKVLARATERFEKALGAVMLIRFGRKECAALGGVVGSQAALTPLLRKQVSRHADSCDECTRRRKALVNPATMSASAATKAASTVLAPPGLRDTIVASMAAGVASSTHYRWKRNGFPRMDRRRRTAPTVAMVGGLLALSVLVVHEVQTEPFRAPSAPVTVPVTVPTTPVPATTATTAVTTSTTSTTIATTTTTSMPSTTTSRAPTTTVAPTTAAPTTVAPAATTRPVPTTVAVVAPATTRPARVSTTTRKRRRVATIPATAVPEPTTVVPEATIAPDPATQPPTTPAPIFTPDPVITATQPPVVTVVVGTTVPPTVTTAAPTTTAVPVTTTTKSCPPTVFCPNPNATTTTTRLIVVRTIPSVLILKTIPPIVILTTTTLPIIK